MAGKTEVYKLELEGQQFVSMASDMKTKIINLEVAQKKMKGTAKETSAVYIKNTVSLKENKKELSVLEKQIGNNNKMQVETTKIVSDTTTELKKNGVTINELRAQNKKLLDVKNNLILTNKDEAKLAKEIDQKLNDNNETIKENSDALTQQKINIGNYGSALNGVSPMLTQFITTGQAMVE